MELLNDKQVNWSTVLCTYGFCQKVALNRGVCLNFNALNFVYKELAEVVQAALKFRHCWSCWKESNGLGIILHSFNALYF